MIWEILKFPHFEQLGHTWVWHRLLSIAQPVWVRLSLSQCALIMLIEWWFFDDSVVMNKLNWTVSETLTSFYFKLFMGICCHICFLSNIWVVKHLPHNPVSWLDNDLCSFTIRDTNAIDRCTLLTLINQTILKSQKLTLPRAVTNRWTDTHTQHWFSYLDCLSGR